MESSPVSLNSHTSQSISHTTPKRFTYPIMFVIEKTVHLQEPCNEELLNSMKTGGSSTLRGTQRPKHENNAIPRIAPKWLKHDR